MIKNNYLKLKNLINNLGYETGNCSRHVMAEILIVFMF